MSNNVEILLRGWGLTDSPEEFSDGIHSWRCEHPARYGRCNCFQEAVDELSELIRKEREEAWDVGHMQGISDRDSATRDGNYWEVPVTDNPYRKEQP